VRRGMKVEKAPARFIREYHVRYLKCQVIQG
jgi:hypothetical protein